MLCKYFNLNSLHETQLKTTQIKTKFTAKTYFLKLEAHKQDLYVKDTRKRCNMHFV